MNLLLEIEIIQNSTKAADNCHVTDGPELDDTNKTRK